ncbi:MAG: type II secretion system F family protein [Kiritimatiellia bacterium]
MSPILIPNKTTTFPAQRQKQFAPGGLASRAAAASHDKERTHRQRTRGVPGAHKIVANLVPSFSRQLAAMLTSGMPVVTSLEALEEQTDNPNFKTVINRIRKAIEGGSSFSESLQQFPTIFDELYRNMVKAGETGGQLAETIGRLAGFLEASSKLRRRIKSAMTYPVIVLCIALAIATAMIIFVVPVFGEMFADFGARLPGPTQFLMNTSQFIRHNGLYIGIAVAAVVFAFKKWKATPRGALAVDRFVLKTPIFGELTRKVAAARFARTFAQLLRSGVPILNALEIVSGATGNRAAGQVITDCRTAVENGEPLSTALTRQTIFPMLFVRMLQAGEKTGKVDDMMESIADFYEDEIEVMLASLTSLLEPMLMVFLGIIVGGIVVCMFLPIFKMSEVVTR